MATLSCNESHSRRTLRVLAALAVLLALCVATVVTGETADPANAAKAKLIGKTKKAPEPDCPERTKGGRVVHACSAVGHMTAFQVSAGDKKNVFAVPSDGKLVAWSIALSRPKPGEQRAFEKLLKSKKDGSKPLARIAVLRKTQGTKYKLQSQGPLAELSDYLGTTPIFTLKDPLRVKKGDVIGITIPTWAPNFATGQAKSNKWRASRSPAPESCDVDATKSKGKKNLEKSKTQTKVGSTKSYACIYSQTRLLYWGYYTT